MESLQAIDIAGNIVKIDKDVVDKMSQKQLEQLIKYSEIVSSPAKPEFSHIRQYFN